jgi:hypothetical protein
MSQFEDNTSMKSLAGLLTLHKDLTFFLNHIANYRGFSFICTNFDCIFSLIDLVAQRAEGV